MPDESGGGVRIGRLRWKVQFAVRSQVPDAGTGIVETLVTPQSVHADIQASSDATFWGSTQVETPITHTITLRWQDYPDNTVAVIRATQLPSGGQRVETFRVRKVNELAGRKRFIRLACQLENTEPCLTSP